MTMIAEGKYRGRPVAAALGTANTGTEQIAVQFDFVEPAGTRLTWYGFFTEAAEQRTIESLRHCGWRGNDLAVFVEGQPLPEGFDQEVELVVKHETYNGTTRARIAFVNGGGGLALKNALTADQAKSFAEKMKRRIAAFDRAAGRAAPAGPSARPAAARPPARAAAPAQPVDDGENDPDRLEARAAEEAGARGEDVPF
jgi:hypothetical protein